MKINILGTIYTVDFSDAQHDEKLKEADGYCDNTTKECVIDNCNTQDVMTKGDLNEYKKKLVRHELTHAFLFESGLGENSNWAANEEMVDWFAYQFPKIAKAFQEAKCL
jgi:hypothetical protein